MDCVNENRQNGLRSFRIVKLQRFAMRVRLERIVVKAFDDRRIETPIERRLRDRFSESGLRGSERARRCRRRRRMYGFSPESRDRYIRQIAGTPAA
jgi:hypothetical protein